MTLGEIEAFLAIYEQRNMTKAAQKMYISQPSLSAKLKLLENELGCSLFIRNKGQQNMTVTKEGEALYPLALQYMDILKQMKQIKNQRNADRLSICATNSIGYYLLTPAYELFIHRHDNVHMEMQDAETAAAYQFIESGFMDLALTPNVDTSARIPAMPILKEAMVFICSHRSSYPASIDMHDIDLKNEIYIQWSEAFVSWHHLMFPQRDQMRIRVEMMNQLEYFLQKENTWAFVPMSIGLHLMKHHQLRIIPCNFAIPGRIISCLYHPYSHKKELQMEFLKCFKESIQKEYSDHIEFYI